MTGATAWIVCGALALGHTAAQDALAAEVEGAGDVEEAPSSASESADDGGPAGESADDGVPAGESADDGGPAGESADDGGPAGESADDGVPEGESADDDGPEARSEAEDANDREGEPESTFQQTPPPYRATRTKARPRPEPAYDPDSGMAPGGYWAPGTAPVIEPSDGENELLVAYILLPLGTLATASAGAMMWATAPGHCERRLASFGYSPTADQCRGLWIYNVIRLSYGAAELVTGAVMLGIGLHRKKQYELWKKRRFQTAWRPHFGVHPQRRGAAVDLTFHF